MIQFVKDDKKNNRHDKYKFATDIYNGVHSDYFNKNLAEYKLTDLDYICFGLVKQAVDTKVDLIWSNAPKITFENETLQQEFDNLRAETSFDDVLTNFTKDVWLLGDSILKVTIDNNDETSLLDDFKLSLYPVNPHSWVPVYNLNNVNKYPKFQIFILEKDIDNQKAIKAYLLEVHSPGKIQYFAYRGDRDQYTDVPVSRDWSEELEGVLTNNGNELQTGCTYSLLQFLQNDKSFDNFFGKTDLSNPVVSKLNALNSYANLANVVIETNVFPKLILSEEMGKKLKSIIEEINNQRGGDNEVDNNSLRLGEIATAKQYLSSESYLTSIIYRKLVESMKAFVDGGRGETKYLQNDFDLEQLRKQHDIFFKSLMSELGIAEVFYNPALSTGATSGAAYRRLMSMTLNEVDRMKRRLEPFIKKLVYTMLELGKNNNLITSEAEYPSVQFEDGLIDDENEKLQMLVTKYSNNFIPLKEAIMQSNNLDEIQAQSYIDDINQANVEAIALNQENQANITDSATPASVTE